MAHAPYENVYLHWLIESVPRRAHERILIAREPDGSVRGVAHDAPNIALAGDEAAIDAFAHAFARRLMLPRMIVAPRPLLERFWKRVHGKLPAPWAIRPSQPVYGLELGWLHADDGDLAGVQRATLVEADEIVAQAARMAAGELGGDAEKIDAGYRARLEANIAAGCFWRYRVGGRLVFQCYVGPTTAETAQLQGIWTPPEARGHGYATRGLGSVCHALLAEHRTVSLYVNDFNRVAIALYERLGFRRVGEFASVIF